MVSGPVGSGARSENFLVAVFQPQLARVEVRRRNADANNDTNVYPSGNIERPAPPAPR